MTEEQEALLERRIRAVINSPSDRLDHLVTLTGLDPQNDLRYGDWSDLDLAGADLRGFDFTGADLRGTRFTNALVKSAVFKNAEIDGSALHAASDYDGKDDFKKYMRQYDLVERVRRYNTETNEDLLNRAYVYGMKALAKSSGTLTGSRFFEALEATKVATDLGVDDVCIVSTILKDVLSTEATRAEVHQVFSEEIANLVVALEKIQFDTSANPSLTDKQLRQLLLAGADQPKVFLVKLAELLNMLRILVRVGNAASYRLAKEIFNIYSPIGRRLGCRKLCDQLEDLAFQHLDPSTYDDVSKRSDHLMQRYSSDIFEVESMILHHLDGVGIEAKVEVRRRTAYSIWGKAEQLEGIETYSDIVVFYVTVESLEKIYAAIGALHSLWPVVPGRFMDYVSTPFENDYQSIHTTLIGPGNRRVVLRLQTPAMLRIADEGIAAHWQSDCADELSRNGTRKPNVLEWLRALALQIHEGVELADLFPPLFIESYNDDRKPEGNLRYSEPN